MNLILFRPSICTIERRLNIKCDQVNIEHQWIFVEKLEIESKD